MKRFFSTVALIVGALALSTGNAFAVSSCINTVDVTTLNILGGCTVGNLLFSNFQVTPGGQVGIVQANNPGVGGVGLNFNPNLTNSILQNDIHFAFTVTAQSGTLSSVYLYNGATVGANGSSSIGEEVCNSLGVNLSGACTGAQLATVNADAGLSSTVSFANQTSVVIWKDINIGGTAHLSSFDQNFGSSNVPEPATFSMLGFGLLGLGLAARKRANR